MGAVILNRVNLGHVKQLMAMIMMAAAVLIWPMSANAENQSSTAHPASIQQIDLPSSPAGKPIPCTCRYQGNDFQQGQQVCIRGEMAVCGMYLNNTSWKFTKAPCPLASLTPSSSIQ